MATRQNLARPCRDRCTWRGTHWTTPCACFACHHNDAIGNGAPSCLVRPRLPPTRRREKACCNFTRENNFLFWRVRLWDGDFLLPSQATRGRRVTLARRIVGFSLRPTEGPSSAPQNVLESRRLNCACGSWKNDRRCGDWGGG